MNNPIPLDLARRVRLDCYIGTAPDADTAMQAALAAHLPEIAALPAVRDLVLADRREADVELKRITAALDDAHHGGHWEECDHSAFFSDEAKRGRRRGTYEAYSTVTYERWVPATPPDPDAALLAIVDADTLARLREVAEVTAR